MSRIADSVKQKEDREVLSGLIQRALVAARIPKKRAAETARIKPSHFSQVLAGRKSLGKEKLIALARVLNIPYKQILLAGGYSADALPVIELQNLLTPVVSVEPIQVVTDPRFPDSAFFLWIFSQQPFRSLGAECMVVATDWRNVPETVANARYAIGFYNRRAQITIGQKRVLNLAYWIDLCLYRGYALLARAADASSIPATLSVSNGYLETLIERCRREKRKPVILSMGADTVWRLRNPLNPLLQSSAFTVQVFGNADFALREFLNGVGDLFVGGLSQRIAAQVAGCVEILNSEINPLLFSLNALIGTSAMLSERKTFLIAASAVWFETIEKLKKDERFRHTVIQEILHLLSEREIRDHSLTVKLLDECFGEGSGRFEYFPGSPTELLDELLHIVGRSLCTAPRDQLSEVFATLQETLRKEIDE